tara:strand:+ start:1423 stop:1656 length:234 start_codon:yes stop_codon:yes gene_type:complete
MCFFCLFEKDFSLKQDISFIKALPCLILFKSLTGYLNRAVRHLACIFVSSLPYFESRMLVSKPLESTVTLTSPVLSA